ncbi:hypothetical protein, partial [Amycolatopsis lurida]|uniref:hypothetical protein n=1 Tax=Amycolatopsis lurida TaxID=31959 RepID=UPI00365A8B26
STKLSTLDELLDGGPVGTLDLCAASIDDSPGDELSGQGSSAPGRAGLPLGASVQPKKTRAGHPVMSMSQCRVQYRQTIHDDHLRFTSA